MIKLMVEDYLEDYPYWRSVTVPIEDKQLFIDGIHELGLDWKLGHEDGNGRIGLKVYGEQEDLSDLADYVDSRKGKTESFGRRKLREQDVEIEVKNKGILEVPEDKNVDDLPMSHFEKLVKKHGLSKITKALNNLQVWNKNDDKKLSKWAGNMIDKLTKKFGKNESIKEDYITVDGISYDEYEINRKYRDLIRSDKVDALHGIYYDVGGNEDEFIIDAIDSGFSKLDIVAFLMYAVEDSLSFREIKGLFKSLNISLKESSMYDYYDVPDGAFDMHNDMPTEEDEMWSELSTKQREIINALEELGYRGSLTRFFSKIIGSWTKVYDTDKSTSSGVEITVDLDGKVTVQEFVYAVDEEDLTDLSPVKIVKSSTDVKKLDSWAKRIKKHDISL